LPGVHHEFESCSSCLRGYFQGREEISRSAAIGWIDLGRQSRHLRQSRRLENISPSKGLKNKTQTINPVCPAKAGVQVFPEPGKVHRFLILPEWWTRG